MEGEKRGGGNGIYRSISDSCALHFEIFGRSQASWEYSHGMVWLAEKKLLDMSGCWVGMAYKTKRQTTEQTDPKRYYFNGIACGLVLSLWVESRSRKSFGWV